MQRCNELVEIAVNQAIKIMKREPDAVIRHAVLREIVGANFFFTSAGTDLAGALCTVSVGFLALLSLQQTCAQHRKCSFLVFDLTAALLTTNDCACRNVQYLHGGIGCVYALPARATRAQIGRAS